MQSLNFSHLKGRALTYTHFETQDQGLYGSIMGLGLFFASFIAIVLILIWYFSERGEQTQALASSQLLQQQLLQQQQLQQQQQQQMMMMQQMVQPVQMYSYPPNMYTQGTMPSMYATPQFISEFPQIPKTECTTRAIQTSGNIYVNQPPPPTIVKPSLRTIPTQTSQLKPHLQAMMPIPVQIPTVVPLPSPMMGSIETSTSSIPINPQNGKGSDGIRTLDYDNGMLKSPSGRILQQIFIEGLQGPPLYALVSNQPYKTEGPNIPLAVSRVLGPSPGALAKQGHPPMPPMPPMPPIPQQLINSQQLLARPMTPPSPAHQALITTQLTGSTVSAQGIPYNPLNLPPINPPPPPSAIRGFPPGANPMMPPLPVAMVTSGLHAPPPPPPPPVQPYAPSPPPGLVYPTLPPLGGHGHIPMMGRPTGRLI